MEEWNRLLQAIDGYRCVVVTGPQRSGTTFIATAMANDTGRRLILEEEFQVDNWRLWWSFVNRSQNSVMQCPGMFHYVHLCPPDVFVVVVRRPVDEIVASQNRIRWGYEEYEKGKYVGMVNNLSGPVAAVKYRYWDTRQKGVCKKFMELPYHAMEDHPLWVPAEERKNFHPRQVKRERYDE